MIDLEASKRALADEQHKRREAEERWSRVNQVHKESQRLKRENNFSKLVEEAMYLRRGH